MRTAKWILLFIPLAMMSGCSQDREERRETVKSILLSTDSRRLLVSRSPTPDRSQGRCSEHDRSAECCRRPPGTPTKHIPDNHPDVE